MRGKSSQALSCDSGVRSIRRGGGRRERWSESLISEEESTILTERSFGGKRRIGSVTVSRLRSRGVEQAGKRL